MVPKVPPKSATIWSSLADQFDKALFDGFPIPNVMRVILVNMEISVILGHEKTKIRNIIDYGKIDVFSVRTIIHIKNKMMGHLI